MEFILELIFELLWWISASVVEAFLTFLFEATANVTLGPVDVDERPRRAWLWAVGCFALGALCGGVSVLLVPELLLTTTATRVVSLIAAPLIAGMLTSWWGESRRRRGAVEWRLDRFANAYLFALAFGMVRYLCAEVF